MYDFEIKSVVDELNQIVENNEFKIKDVSLLQIQRVETMIDLQCKIATYFTGWWFSGVAAQRSRHKEFDQILFAAFHKNIISFFSALKMNSSGLYGSVRPLMRNIFEWLMIAKFSSLSENPTVMKKWGIKRLFIFQMLY